MAIEKIHREMLETNPEYKKKYEDMLFTLSIDDETFNKQYGYAAFILTEGNSNTLRNSLIF